MPAVAMELDDTAQAAERTATAPKPAAAASSVGRELPEGTRLGHFQVIKKLGAGGMGEVYLATDLALDRQVALKVLPGGAGSTTARERLVREARAQARVQHTNVAHIYFIGEDAGLLYFAMEYVGGQTLAQVIEQKPLAPDDALALIHDAVLGLREAQRSGFTHRDVKPSNVMLDGHGVVKILDFGIAAGGESASEGGTVEQTSLAGTPLYMAPEQARGEPVDFRADVYALGATLFQLVTGKPPFVADTLDELRTLHASAPRPALPRTMARTKSAALFALIGKMMAPRAEDRFGSYDELLRAIQNASSQFTRPAGLIVRGIAMLIDVVVVALLLVLVEVVATGSDTDVSLNLEMPVFALAQMLLLRRFGTTLGGALLDIEVVDVRYGSRPGWSAVGKRTVALYGVFVIPILKSLARYAGLPSLEYVFRWLGYGLIAYFVLAIAHAALRSPGKRAVWDRWSGTMVRYRHARRAR